MITTKMQNFLNAVVALGLKWITVNGMIRTKEHIPLRWYDGKLCVQPACPMQALTGMRGCTEYMIETEERFGIKKEVNWIISAADIANESEMTQDSIELRKAMIELLKPEEST